MRGRVQSTDTPHIATILTHPSGGHRSRLRSIMGVKDLWTILAPVKCEKSLEELAGKRLAVDLSGWVCQADTTKVVAR